jgi:hypothetical protein
VANTIIESKEKENEVMGIESDEAKEYERLSLEFSRE